MNDRFNSFSLFIILMYNFKKWVVVRLKIKAKKPIKKLTILNSIFV